MSPPAGDTTAVGPAPTGPVPCGPMALYEYRCRTCDTVFESRRPMAQADSPATCPGGHTNAVRLLSVFATVGGGGSADPACASPMMREMGGCGGHCACH